jgi:hypothetical protein
MLKMIWGRKPKTEIGLNADQTLWNTGQETPSAILCGLLATKIVQHKLDPSSAVMPTEFTFALKSEANTATTPKKARVNFSNNNSFRGVEILNKNGDHMYGHEPSFTKAEQEIFLQAYVMLANQLEKLHEAWKVEQNQNKALKLIEGLVE